MTTRMFPDYDSSHLPDSVRLWLGESGRSVGGLIRLSSTRTTSATTPPSVEAAPARKLHMIERFTRVDANSLKYEVTIDDPATWTKPGRLCCS